jgi:hypothetical protein
LFRLFFVFCQFLDLLDQQHARSQSLGFFRIPRLLDLFSVASFVLFQQFFIDIGGCFAKLILEAYSGASHLHVALDFEGLHGLALDLLGRIA